MRQVLASALIAMAGAAGAQPLEFKGVPMGASVETFRLAIFPQAFSFECLDYPPEGTDVCFVKDTTYANEPVSEITATFTAGQLATVQLALKQRSFPAVVAAIAAKYGKPRSDVRSKVQNGFGATFDQRSVTWERPEGVIMADRVGAKPTESWVTLMSREHVQAGARRKSALPPAKKDI